MDSTQEATKRPGALSRTSELLTRGLDLYKKHFWDLVSLQLLQVAIILSLGFITVASANIVGAFMLGLVGVFATIVISLSMIYVVHRQKGVVPALSEALKNLGGYLWVTILVTLIVTGGLVLLMVPGIIFSIWFALAAYIFVIEGKKGMAALLTGREYTRNRWWPVFGRILVLVGVAIVAGIAVSILEGIFGEGMGRILGYLVNILFAPFAITYLYSLYKDVAATRVEVEPTGGKGMFIGFAIFGLLIWLILPLILGIIYTFVGFMPANFEGYEGLGPIELEPNEDFDFSEIDLEGLQEINTLR